MLELPQLRIDARLTREEDVGGSEHELSAVHAPVVASRP
jgi:hypothetical protein